MSIEPPPTLTLRIVDAPDGVRIPDPWTLVAGEPLLMGRGGESAWVLPDKRAKVSREHARIERVDGGWRLTDLSSNGTIVDGLVLRQGESGSLVHGSTIVMGDYRMVAEGTDHQRVIGDGDIFSDDDWQAELRDRERDPPPGPKGASERSLGWFKSHEVNLAQLIAQELQSVVGDPIAVATGEPAAAATDDTRLLDSFLAGVGLPAMPSGIPPERVLHEAGAALRSVTIAMASMLAARRALKDEFRIRQTVIAGSGNNPLKFSTVVDEMLQAMLGASQPGFLGGEAAAAQAGRDLAHHQLAMMAGFRALIETLLEELAPRKIALGAAQEQRGLDRLMPGRVEAEQWKRFVATHEAISDDFTRSFNGRLGQVFAQAYERATDDEC